MANSACSKSLPAVPRKPLPRLRRRSDSARGMRGYLFWYFWICHAHTHLAQDREAIEWCLRSVSVNPLWFAYADLASAYAWTGQDAEARTAVAERRKLMPNYTVDRGRNFRPSDDPVFIAQYERITEGVVQSWITREMIHCAAQCSKLEVRSTEHVTRRSGDDIAAAPAGDVGRSRMKPTVR